MLVVDEKRHSLSIRILLLIAVIMGTKTIFGIAVDSKYSERTIEASLGNKLSLKPSAAITLDPRIRKALLNVLSRLDAQDQIPTVGTINNLTANFGEKLQHDQSNTREYSFASIPAKFEYKTMSNPTAVVRNTIPRQESKPKASFKLSAAKISVAPAELFNTFDNHLRQSTTGPEILDTLVNELQPQLPQQSYEPEALFFQIPLSSTTTHPTPTSVRPSTKHETLSGQETKNALTSAEEILSKILYQQRAQKEAETVSQPRTSKPANQTNTIAQNEDTEEEEEGEEEEVEVEEEEGKETRTEKEKNPSNEAVADKDFKKEVEVFQAPLLTAFTLEQDARGVPHRIIPLSHFQLLSEINPGENLIKPTTDEFNDSQRLRNHEQQSSTRSIDAFKSTSNTFPAQNKFLVPAPQSLGERQRQNYQASENEKQRLFAEQIERAKAANFALHRQRQQQQHLQQQQQQQQQQQFVPVSHQFAAHTPVVPVGYNTFNGRDRVPLPHFNDFTQIAWQKSLETSLPFQSFDQRELAGQQQQPIQPLPLGLRANRYQILPSQSRPLPTYPGHPETVDRRLQILLQQSGLNNGYRHEDLNIVSKVLALNVVDKPPNNQLDDGNIRPRRASLGLRQNIFI